MTCKFCGLKYLFNNIKVFKKDKIDDSKTDKVLDIESDVYERYAVFHRARSLKLVGPNLVSVGDDVLEVKTISRESSRNSELKDEN
uniref:Uncharacterized protein n=1 Tax=Parastrongyloides trichosuri TaxID=131310 RepID=A0A0N5A3L6_PARTI